MAERSIRSWLADLVQIAAAPGDEHRLVEYVAGELTAMGHSPTVDEKGNVVVGTGTPRIVVTAHMDEIALIVSQVGLDGTLRVAPLGGAYTWKWGEGPVEISGSTGLIAGVLGYGSIHTNAEASTVEHARNHPLDWQRATVFTGLDSAGLSGHGIRVGSRVTLARARRTLTDLPPYVASYFLDDRADIAVWLELLHNMSSGSMPDGLYFAATAAEEIGGHGASWLMRRLHAPVCLALEIGPRTPEAEFDLDANPTVWVRDSYAAMQSVDTALVAECCAALDIAPHWQYLSRGGSDATCAAAVGLCARPVTFGLPVENSHGYEIMHSGAPEQLARLTGEYITRCLGTL